MSVHHLNNCSTSHRYASVDLGVFCTSISRTMCGTFMHNVKCSWLPYSWSRNPEVHIGREAEVAAEYYLVNNALVEHVLLITPTWACNSSAVIFALALAVTVEG